MSTRTTKAPVVHSLKRGVYETVGGFSALVTGPNAQEAYDLDCFGTVPIEYVKADKFLRAATQDDFEQAGIDM